ncbi:Uncharacterised protein [Mycobacteroides abscessus subsp. abscessus]|nr:Uncharacterised protein [Mycobacteroides abscessus subsp. abscessus]
MPSCDSIGGVNTMLQPVRWTDHTRLDCTFRTQCNNRTLSYRDTILSDVLPNQLVCGQICH